MKHKNFFIELRDVLAYLYLDSANAERIASDAGLDLRYLKFDSHAINNWHAILKEAGKTGKLDTLLAIVDDVYGGNTEFADVYAKYLQNPTLVVDEWLTDPTDFTPANILRSAQRLTPEAIQLILPPHNIIQRTTVRLELDHFFASVARSNLLLGASDVGKSVVLALQARKLLDEGWAVFLIRDLPFSLTAVAEYIVKNGLGYKGTLDWREVLITPWQSAWSAQIKGFALLIDELFDTPDVDFAIGELKQLHMASRQVPSSAFKLLIACHDTWEADRLSFLINPQSLGDPSNVNAKLIRVADFTAAELSDAFHGIGAGHILQPRQPGELPDPHVENLLDLLKHPSIWGLYARSYHEGTRLATAAISWNSLLENYLSTMLHEAQQRCRFSADLLHEQLMQFAQLARVRQTHDFRLARSELRTNLSILQVDDINPTSSPYAALRELGIFLESAKVERNEIKLAFSDLGAYLLSFVLEREAQSQEQTASTLTTTVQNWLNEVYNYAPLMDALLILVDRLAHNPRKLVLQVLLANLIESHTVRLEVALRLIQPATVSVLFEIVAQKELDSFYLYKRAVRALRATPDTIRNAQNYLFDRRHPQVQQLAACFLGANREASCITELVELLEDNDRDLRRDVYDALFQIGEPAIPFLLAVSADPSKLVNWRMGCLHALRVVRVRNLQVSNVLTTCLQEGIETGNAKLLSRTLLTAAAIRDETQVEFAIKALAFADWEVVGNAAKLLTETPSTAAAPMLEAILQGIKLQEADSFMQDLAASQTLAALLAVNTIQTRVLVVHYLEESIRGIGILPSMTAIARIEEWHLPELAGVLLESFVQTITNTTTGTSGYHVLRQFDKIWQAEGLSVLVQTADHLLQQGTNITRLIVDALIESEDIERHHVLHDHHLRVAGLHMLAKCQPANWVDEIVRLLACPGRSNFDLAVCDALWIVGDERAETALIQKLEQSTNNDTHSHESSRILRALGTCTSQQGAAIILEHIKNSKNLDPYNIADECLCPLVYRERIHPDQIVGLAQNAHATPISRAACIVALGILDANTYAHLFADLLAVNVPVLQAYAARMLGFAKQPVFVPVLRWLLRHTRDGFVAEQAAFALGKLDAQDAVIDIERAFKVFADTERTLGFINALEQLHQPSSVEILLDVVARRHFGHTEDAIIEALGAFWFDPRARQKIIEWLESWYGGYDDIGRQAMAVHTLAYYTPSFLVDQASRLYDAGRLHKSARKAVARSLASLWRVPELNPAALKALFNRCICDLDFAVREVAGQALASTDVAFCQQLFDELYSTQEPWVQACAVRTLGDWGERADQIEPFRYAETFSIRYFADGALEKLNKRKMLADLVTQYQSPDGLTRLSAYLAIQQHGTIQTVQALYAAVDPTDLAYVFLRQLAHDVNKRCQKEFDEEAKEEDKVLKGTGMIKYD